MSGEAAAWRLEVDAAFAEEIGSLRDAVEYIGIQAIRRVDMRSPVDTGRFRANWTISIGEPSSAITPVEDKTGSTTVAGNVAALAEYPKDGKFPVIYLQNNLPYAERLEFGHSAQAPSGMVAITVAELEALMHGIEI